MTHQKIGGIAAIVEAALYITGIAVLFLFLTPEMSEVRSDLEQLRFVIDNKTLFQVWYVLIYVVFGLVLIPLTIVINEHFKTASLFGTQVAPVLGFIWAGLVISSGMITIVGMETVNDIIVQDPSAAVTAWQIVGSIRNALGGGVEIVGGLWVFLISVYGVTQSVFPRRLNYLGLLVGGAGILTIVPGLKELGLMFGLSQIIWFAWIGISMLTDTKQAASTI
ncbi:MAG: hypothetical protein AAF446_00025 [Pseudomonadota bacterium]